MLSPIDVDTSRTGIETGRSWRDLPESPPRIGAPQMHAPEAPVEFSQPRRGWPWGLTSIGAVALIAGVAVGAWAPWDRVADQSPEETAAAESLPEVIIPPGPGESAAPQPEASPEDLFEFFFDEGPDGFLESLPDELREQIPEGLFDPGPPGVESADPGLIELRELPEGFRVQSTSLARTAGNATEQIRLAGPGGAVSITARQDPAVELPRNGQAIDVNGVEARLVEGDTIRISWLARPDLLVTVEGPGAIGTDTLIGIAESVEVAP